MYHTKSNCDKVTHCGQPPPQPTIDITKISGYPCEKKSKINLNPTTPSNCQKPMNAKNSRCVSYDITGTRQIDPNNNPNNEFYVKWCPSVDPGDTTQQCDGYPWYDMGHNTSNNAIVDTSKEGTCKTSFPSPPSFPPFVGKCGMIGGPKTIQNSPSTSSNVLCGFDADSKGKRNFNNKLYCANNPSQHRHMFYPHIYLVLLLREL